MKIENTYIVLEDKTIYGDVYISDGLIKSIETKKAIEQDKKTYLVPGFIDVHIHGSNGYDAMDTEDDSIEKLALSLVREGTTGFLPTTMTQTTENILKALSHIGQYEKHQNPNAAQVLGIHLEGPFISKFAAGAQPLNCIVEANTNLFKSFENASCGLIKKVSIAPEINGASELITYLKSRHIIASIAHTKATYEMAKEAIRLGATSSTHTYNAMTPLHHRDVGVVGATLLHKELSAELIFDTVHTTKEAAQILYNAKGPEGVILITDSMRAKYLQEGTSELGGQTVYIKDNQARLQDGTLAGSILKMNDGYRNLVTLLGASMSEASMMASLNPARSLGLDSAIGSIKEGKLANLVLLNESFDVLKTIINGRVVFKKAV